MAADSQVQMAVIRPRLARCRNEPARPATGRSPVRKLKLVLTLSLSAAALVAASFAAPAYAQYGGSPSQQQDEYADEAEAAKDDYAYVEEDQAPVEDYEPEDLPPRTKAMTRAPPMTGAKPMTRATAKSIAAAPTVPPARSSAAAPVR